MMSDIFNICLEGDLNLLQDISKNILIPSDELFALLHGGIKGAHQGNQSEVIAFLTRIIFSMIVYHYHENLD